MKKSRLNVIFDKLMELIRKFRTWLARMMQRARSMPVQVSSKGKVYISATKAACIKVNTCVNNTYAFVLNLINGKNPTMGELDEGFDSALEALTTAGDARDNANITIRNIPVAVWDTVMGTTKRIEAIIDKTSKLEAPAGASSEVTDSLDTVKIVMSKRSQKLISALQSLVCVTEKENITDEDIKNSKPIRLTNDKASAKAADKVLGKEASESYDAVAMARAAASEGNLEAVVENMLISMGLIDEPNSELDALESEINTSLLEADLLFA